MDPTTDFKRRPRLSLVSARFGVFCVFCAAALVMVFWPTAGTIKHNFSATQSATLAKTGNNPEGVKEIGKQEQPEFVHNEIIVKFKASVPVNQRIQALSKIGAMTKKVFRSDQNINVIILPSSISVADALAYFKKTAITLYAEPNYVYHASVLPNDPSFNQLWGLHNIGQEGGSIDFDLNGPEAWDIDIGSRDVVIGVIDTGVDYGHQDLIANIWSNAGEIPNNNIDDDNNGWVDDIHGINTIDRSGDPMDDNSHGTHVSGTIAARGNDKQGVVGVMWEAQIVGCKFLSSSGSGTTEDALLCLEYFSDLKDAGVNIVATNNSWGGGGFSQALADAIETHQQKGILFVAAAGNSSSNIDISPSYPASYDLDNIISVAALDRHGDMASFSNYGSIGVDIAAPGVDILSTIPGNSWDTYSGTSMAAPHVTGIIGLIKANQPDFSQDQLKAYLLETALTYEPLNGLVLQSKRAVIELPFIDEDEDLMSDDWEREFGLDPTNPLDADGDLDSDGLSNLDEFLQNTNPTISDSDSDGVSDGDEVNTYQTDPLSEDTDADGLSDFDEINSYNTDPAAADSDNDGITDGDEIHQYGTNPLSSDSDGDNISDGWEIEFGLDPISNGDAAADSDNDGLSNQEEFEIGTSPLSIDSDGDTLTDFDEVNLHRTNPTSADSDSDRISDNWELDNRLDPLDPTDASRDFDSDLFNNLAEYSGGSDPNDPESVPPIQSWLSYQGGSQHNAWLLISSQAEDFSERWFHADSSLQNLKYVVSKNGSAFYQSSESYSNQTVTSISTINGAAQWNRTFQSVYDSSNFGLDNERLYLTANGFGTDSNNFHALDVTTGEIHYSVSDPNTSTYVNIVPTDDGIYLPTPSSIIKKSKSTGETLWEYQTQTFGAWHGPAINDDTVAIFDGALKLISDSTGENTATITVPENCQQVGYYSPPVMFGDLVAVSTQSCVLLFNITINELVWQKNINAKNLIIQNQHLLVQTENSIQNLHLADGHLNWEWSAPMGGLHQNIVSTINHFFVSDWANTYAVNIENQELDWTFNTSGFLSMTDDGALLISSSFGITAINIEGDSDEDGLPNWWERHFSLDPTEASDASADIDDDGLNNLEEYSAGTSPILDDSDVDGLTDYTELNETNTDPTNADSDNDGLSDGDEIKIHNTDPNNMDSDGDFINDGDEVNRYGTNPSDPESAPDLLRDFTESFENGVPDTWLEPANSSAPWTLDTGRANQGTNSIRSGIISDNQQSVIEWTENYYAGEISFDAFVSTESCCDFLHFYIDNELRQTVTSNESWQSVRIAISSGQHTLRWEFNKDYSVSSREDAAWVDNIEHSTPAPFASDVDNILVADSASMFEFDHSGNATRLPLPVPHSSDVKDLVITPDHNIVFADREKIHIYNPNSGHFISPTINGFAEQITSNNDGLWLTNASENYGLIRLTNSGEFVAHFSENTSYIDIDHNQTGNIYALRSDSNNADIFSPDTLDRIETITLSGGTLIKALSIAEDGSIFATDAENNILHYNSHGEEMNRYSPEEITGDFIDIDISSTGKIVLGFSAENRSYASINSDFSDFKIITVPTGTPAIYSGIYVTTISRDGLDSDRDGIPDWWETRYNLDPFSANDALLDLDNDELTNLMEFEYQTLPNNSDTDADQLSDGPEVNTYQTDPLSQDTDRDGLSDFHEIISHFTSPTQSDSDGDGLSDGDEVNIHQTLPLNSDTDGDTMLDGWELENDLDPHDPSDAVLDSDRDGLTHSEEFASGTNINLSDTDFDGLSDGDEINTHFTNATLVDSDGDKLNDRWEIEFGFNPNINTHENSDFDEDGYTDLDEFFAGTDPTNASSTPEIIEWTTFKGNASRTSHVPISTNEAHFELRWESQTDSNTHFIPDSLVAGFNEIFVTAYGSDGHVLHKFNSVNGDSDWQLPMGTQIASTLALNREKVFLVAGDYASQSLWSIDRSTGIVGYQNAFSSDISSSAFPSVIENSIYMMANYNQHLHSFDTSTGNENWSTQLDTYGWLMSADNQGVYIYSEEKIRKIDRESGTTDYAITDSNYIWNPNSGLNTPVRGSENWLFVLQGDRVLGIDSLAGEIRWESEVGNGRSLAYARGQVYVISYESIFVFDEYSGEQLWVWDSTDYSLTGHVLVTNDHIFVSDFNNTYGVSLATQEEVWQYPHGGVIALSPEGILIIVNYSSEIAAIDLALDADSDGLPDWWEQQHQLNPNNSQDAEADTDGDGISNFDEFQNNVDPNSDDSDNDGLNDYLEIFEYNTNPRDNDTDSDGLSDYDEIDIYESNPLRSDSDGDGLSDSDEINIYFTDINGVDSDGDGIDDGTEISKETNPNDYQSYPSQFADWFYDFESSVIPHFWFTPENSDRSWEVTSKGGMDTSLGVRSGSIGHGQQSIIQWEDDFVEGSLTFSYLVDSERNFDYFEFYIDGQRLLSESGSSPWQEFSVELSQGMHLISWEYRKDDSINSGGDAVHIDNVSYSAKDTDKDGMPDYWETRFDLDINNPADADLDQDGDGSSSFEEFVAGTNPNVDDRVISPPVERESSNLKAPDSGGGGSMTYLIIFLLGQLAYAFRKRNTHRLVINPDQ